MWDDFYMLETSGRSRVITRGQETAATLWEPITPNSWELSLIYNTASAGNEGWQRQSGLPEPGQAAGAEAGLGAWLGGQHKDASSTHWLAGSALVLHSLGTAGSRKSW